MSSVSEIMGYINSIDSPIEIGTNDVFSIPFISEYCDKVYMAVFSYSRSFYFDDHENTVWVKELFLVNPDKLDDIITVDIRDANISHHFKQLSLFKRNSSELQNLLPYEMYDELITLTDTILQGNSRTKKVLDRYSDLISVVVGNDLLPYYMTFGGKYFSWIDYLVQNSEIV